MASRYDLNHKYRGTALIIGNGFEGQDGLERLGYKKDVIMMEELFKKLDFNVTSLKNLTVEEMKQKLKKASQDKNNEYSDCFVFGLSTHGHEEQVSEAGPTSPANVWRHGVLGEDGATLFVDDIIDYFTDDKAYKLAGKPKLFFLQACRSRNDDNIYVPSPGDRYDQGFMMNVAVTVKGSPKKRRKVFDVRDTEDWVHSYDLTDAEDIYKDWKRDPDEWHPEIMDKSAGSQTSEHDASGGTSEEDAGGSGDSRPLPQSPFDVVPIKCPNDFLIMYPVMSGKFAFRNSANGSYLIQFLHKGNNLKQLLGGCNLLQYLTYVCHDMSRYEYTPDLDALLKKNLQIAARDPLRPFKNMLYGNVKYLSMGENQDLLVRVLGTSHESSLRGDSTRVEPYLRSVIETLKVQQMIDILEVILPFKMAACVVHRLTDNIIFQPKTSNTPMGKLKGALQRKETTV